MLDSIASSVPRTVGAWRAEEPDCHYDPESIFDYIDGHAEVFLAYSMQGCLARRYTGEAADIVLDVFEMATSADAFGVFTHDLEGASVNIGQGSRYRWGWLSFWQGRLFVSITAEDDNDVMREAVLELGRLVAEAAPAESALPAIVEQLPSNGLDRESVRYLHHPQILAWHEPAASGDPFGMGDSGSPVALALYLREGARARVLLIEYDAPAGAAAGLDGAERVFRAGADVHRDEDSGRWAGTRTSGRRLAVVYDADKPEITRRLLRELAGPGVEEEDP